MKNKKLPPIHLGEILMEEFLGPMGISQYRLAKDISVSPRRINEIAHGKRSITNDTWCIRPLSWRLCISLNEHHVSQCQRRPENALKMAV